MEIGPVFNGVQLFWDNGNGIAHYGADVLVVRGSPRTSFWLQVMSSEEYDRTGGRLVLDEP